MHHILVFGIAIIKNMGNEQWKNTAQVSVFAFAIIPFFQVIPSTFHTIPENEWQTLIKTLNKLQNLKTACMFQYLFHKLNHRAFSKNYPLFLPSNEWSKRMHQPRRALKSKFENVVLIILLSHSYHKLLFL